MYLFRYATEVAVTVRPFALSSIAASIIGVIISFLIFITVSTYIMKKTEYL